MQDRQGLVSIHPRLRSGGDALSRTLRQEGLVFQERLENLRVAAVGCHSGLSEALSSVASHLGIGSFPCHLDEADHLILLGDVEAPDTGPDDVTRILLLDDGVRITDAEDREGGTPSELQEFGICVVGASLAFQEVLRIQDCIRQIDIVKSYIAVHYRVDTRDAGASFLAERDLVITDRDGSSIPLFVRERDDGTGHMVVSGRMADEVAARELMMGMDLVSILDTPKAVPSTLELRIPRQVGSVDGDALVAGIGGLGSWALSVFCRGLADSGSSGKGVAMTILDPDPEIELHNLNRQVLYSTRDIGRPKAEAAAEVLSGIVPDADFSWGVQSVGMPELEGIFSDSLDSEDQEDLVDLDVEGSILCPEELADRVLSSDVILSGVDNLRSRAIISGIASSLGIPMINAGAAGWSGQMDVIREGDGCMTCRYGPGIAKDDRVASCQEDGEVPFSSIVTSTAIFGALQGLALMSALSEGESLLDEWPGQVIWGGRSNSLRIEKGLVRGVFGKGDDHLTHIREALGIVPRGSQ